MKKEITSPSIRPLTVYLLPSTLAQKEMTFEYTPFWFSRSIA